MSRSPIGPFKEFDDYDALGLADLVRRREVSSRELVETSIARIEALDGTLNAVVIRCFEQALALAETTPPAGPFAGVPYLAKDLHTSWAGVASTNSISSFSGTVSQSDSLITQRTKNAGFILLGKTNAPEWGWSLTTESPMHGPARNPWAFDRTPGGSSGGAAVAVAAGYLPLADAGDGAGSTRVPAAINGLVGLKPSRGRISPGPEAADFWFGGGQSSCVSRTVRDTAAMLDALQGGYPGEPYYIRERPSFLDSIAPGNRRLRIGFSLNNPRGGTNNAVVDEAVCDAARLCGALGHEVEPFDFDYDFEGLWRAYTGMIRVQTAAQFDDHARARGIPNKPTDMSATIWTTIERGRATSAVQHSRDIEAMRRHARHVAMLTSRYDVVLLPVLPQGTRPLGTYDMSKDIDAYDASAMGEDTVYMMPFNVSGQPALSLPLGMDRSGLPLGVQLVAPPAGEATLFELAASLERARPWYDRRAPFHAANGASGRF
ncbi:amidase [Aminobacter lissarensis]|uniref:Amidase n=1 Tax=Aminobacter carboxidus TaxID=376165 RepID=A0A8E2BDU3_9HYPH|nr:amidase [Aminobacter lissarensis]MBB6467634.1 amidase [Aminobacter lissarensis]